MMKAGMMTMKNDILSTGLNLVKNYAAKTQVDSNRLERLRKTYGEVKAHSLLLQANYFIEIENIFDIKADAPWFHDKSLCFLATDCEISLGSGEVESFNAGVYEANYFTRATASSLSITFLETDKGDISSSYKACRGVIFNRDGTVNEQKKYSFKLTIGFLNPKTGQKTPIVYSWLVGTQEAEITASATGRSEVAKVNITFAKCMPILFAS